MHRTSEQAYEARLRRVLDHIGAHLDEDLGVERLAAVAGLSKYHFHRQFTGLVGVAVHQYVTLRRLKRASYQLAFRPAASVLAIALSNGFGGAESFCRAFRRAFGVSPSAFRRSPDWRAWHAAVRPLTRRDAAPIDDAAPVRITRCDDVALAAVEHRGDPRLVGDAIRRLIAWRRESGWTPPRSATFNLLYDDPESAPPEAFRIDVCAAIPRRVIPSAAGVVRKTIPGGWCAVVRHRGDDDGLRRAIRRLYAEWLPTSGEAPRDFPLYVRRIHGFPDTAERDACTEIFLPLRARAPRVAEIA